MVERASWDTQPTHPQTPQSKARERTITSPKNHFDRSPTHFIQAHHSAPSAQKSVPSSYPPCPLPMMPQEIFAAPIDRRKGPSVRRGTKLKRLRYSKTEPSTDLEIKLFRGSGVPEKQSWLPPRHRVAGLRKRDVGFTSHPVSVSNV